VVLADESGLLLSATLTPSQQAPPVAFITCLHPSVVVPSPKFSPPRFVSPSDAFTGSLLKDWVRFARTQIQANL